jgi:hypothetical protein
VLENSRYQRTWIARRSANNRARFSNNPRKMAVSARTALGRRILDLADGFAVELGGWSAVSETMATNVRKAAELSALAERARGEALRDGDIDPVALVRLEGAATRAVRALGLDRKSEPRGQSLSAYLALKCEVEPSGPQENGSCPDEPDVQTPTGDVPKASEELSGEGPGE